MTTAIYQPCPDCNTRGDQPVCINCERCARHCLCDRPAPQAPASRNIRVRWEEYVTVEGTIVEGEVLVNGHRTAMRCRVRDMGWEVGNEGTTYSDGIALTWQRVAGGECAGIEDGKRAAEEALRALVS